MTEKTLKPKVIINCVADHYSGPSEKIIEFTFPDGTGGLIAFRTGFAHNFVDIYRQDKKVSVIVGKKE